ncbi:uncharacterized protein PFL1_05363 [Pseudozyma flocculosa PF-1]|uniref:Phospholipase/carboxylesterase/thioesterase domain-containing protein n=2 Tax=Pseudozyma flocculosa TaxID=84751 RepID=A0A5C3FA92_9BASI|nr:uncharacterized protein PFL1_05363 [Pseudozyma flocculosa PF-1]EPQ27079.1 hypothetical protein PFL1_05363 [Pseudozyma flocculosa PF-1]SPO41354.1 uncharacterized protein PSFLO_06836 [Pseudozyma flocculosa]
MTAPRPITILYFAGARTLLGTSTETLAFPEGKDTLPLSALPELLASRHPDHADELRTLLESSKWSIDQDMIDADEVGGVTLRPGQEVAVIPPGKDGEPITVHPIEPESKVKPPPTPSGFCAFASSRSSDVAPLIPSVLSYSPAPSGTESNLLLLFHGLGDTARPFATLGQSLQKTLPQTSILSVQASKRVPFLDQGEEAWMWWDTFDSFAEILTKPDPTATVAGIKLLLDYLSAPTDDGGCGWPTFALHLFGFGQGGSVALESMVAFNRARRAREAAAAPAAGEAPPTNPKTIEIGSVVSVCAGLVSHPTIDPLPTTPVLYLHRMPSPPTSTIASLRKATRALNIEKLMPVAQRGGEMATEAMPTGQKEWDPIIHFWARLLRNRIKWEVEGDLYTVG